MTDSLPRQAARRKRRRRSGEPVATWRRPSWRAETLDALDPGGNRYISPGQVELPPGPACFFVRQREPMPGIEILCDDVLLRRQIGPHEAGRAFASSLRCQTGEQGSLRRPSDSPTAEQKGVDFTLIPIAARDRRSYKAVIPEAIGEPHAEDPDMGIRGQLREFLLAPSTCRQVELICLLRELGDAGES